MACTRVSISYVLSLSDEDLDARIKKIVQGKSRASSGMPPLAPFIPMGLVERVYGKIHELWKCGRGEKLGNKQSAVGCVVHDLLYGTSKPMVRWDDRSGGQAATAECIGNRIQMQIDRPKIGYRSKMAAARRRRSAAEDCRLLAREPWQLDFGVWKTLNEAPGPDEVERRDPEEGAAVESSADEVAGSTCMEPAATVCGEVDTIGMPIRTPTRRHTTPLPGSGGSSSRSSGGRTPAALPPREVNFGVAPQVSQLAMQQQMKELEQQVVQLQSQAEEARARNVQERAERHTLKKQKRDAEKCARQQAKERESAVTQAEKKAGNAERRALKAATRVGELQSTQKELAATISSLSRMKLVLQGKLTQNLSEHGQQLQQLHATVASYESSTAELQKALGAELVRSQRLSLHGRAEAAAARDEAEALAADAEEQRRAEERRRMEAEKRSKELSIELTLARRAASAQAASVQAASTSCSSSTRPPDVSARSSRATKRAAAPDPEEDSENEDAMEEDEDDEEEDQDDSDYEPERNERSEEGEVEQGAGKGLPAYAHEVRRA